MKFAVAIFTFLVLHSCSSTKSNYALSKFIYNNKTYNSLIVNRVPKYGNGNPDGCIVMGEMQLSLSSSDSLQATGEIRDVVSLEPLAGARVKLDFGKGKLMDIVSDTQGKFKFNRETKVEGINVAYIGYRALILDVSKRRNIL